MAGGAIAVSIMPALTPAAHALNPGGAISFIDGRSVTFRPKERPTVLVLACFGNWGRLIAEIKGRQSFSFGGRFRSAASQPAARENVRYWHKADMG
jgi:hypothetical protein